MLYVHIVNHNAKMEPLELSLREREKYSFGAREKDERVINWKGWLIDSVKYVHAEN